MKTISLILFLAGAAVAEERRDPRVEAIVQRIEPAHLHATVAKLVSFGTRLGFAGARANLRNSTDRAPENQGFP